MKMKMMLLESMSIMGIFALSGYMIAMKYPEKVQQAKKSIQDACRMIYLKLDEDYKYSFF